MEIVAFLFGWNLLLKNLLTTLITSYPSWAHGIIVIYLQIILRAVCIRNTPFAKEHKHLNGFE